MGFKISNDMVVLKYDANVAPVGVAEVKRGIFGVWRNKGNHE